VCAVVQPAFSASAGVGERQSVARDGANAVLADGSTIVRGLAPRGAKIRAFARAGDAAQVGDVIEAIELPVTVEVGSSRFDVRAEATELPQRFLSSDNVVDVQVIAETAEGILWVDHTSAMAVDVGSRIVWTSPHSPVRPDAGFARLRDGDDGTVGVDVGDLVRTDATQAPAASGRRGGECLPTVINSRWIKARIASSYPAGRSKAWLLVDHSDGGQYQVAMKVPNHPMEKLGMMHASGGWGVETAHTSTAKNYRTDVLYDVVDNRYVATDGTCRYYLTFEPQKESGGMYVKDAKRPNFGNCFPVAGGYTWRRIVDDGRPYRLSYGVNLSAVFYGVDLAVEKNYAPSAHVINYRVVGAHHEMCGSNDVPAMASNVMEKRG